MRHTRSTQLYRLHRSACTAVAAAATFASQYLPHLGDTHHGEAVVAEGTADAVEVGAVLMKPIKHCGGGTDGGCCLVIC